MIKRNLTDEITSVFQYIRDVITKKHPHSIIDEYSFILAILDCEDSLAYQALSSIVMETTLDDMKEYFSNRLIYTVNDDNEDEEPYSLFDSYIVDCDNMCKQLGQKNISSTILLLSILKTDEDISKEMRNFSVTCEQLFNRMKSQMTESTSIVKVNDTPVKHQKKKKNELLKVEQPIKIIDNTSSPKNNEIERSLINISRLATEGKIQHIVSYDDYYKEVFTILSKKERNNVAICGKSGVGKTALVKNIANLIVEKKCPNNFLDKTLVELDFSKFVVGTPFKGAFEQKFYTILEEAKQSENYIFFIDNLQYIVNGSTKYAETDIESLLEELFSETSIQTICTMTQKSFSRLQKKSPLGKYIEDVVIEEPSIEIAVNILNELKGEYEKFHDVLYDSEAVSECVSLCKKYIADKALPVSAINLMDSVGAKMSLNTEENPKINELKNKLTEIENSIDELKKYSSTKEYDKIDELTKEQISIKSNIAILEKEDILSKKPKVITKNDVDAFLSNKIDIPIDDLTKTEKEKLRGINDKLKQSVIGQDEAIDEVCKAVKRQRVGINGNERPAVLMFLGSTGTGKTYLAKQLAKEVFGNEKYFVRMDMSEYSDKTSVNKINGSNPGYIGYDDETFLVKELKKKKRFILLLDEFEKSDEEVHNLFLQMFDEGRFTDNHGDEYSLKDVIIILTSNVGASEASTRGKSIGFCSNDNDFSKAIIEKELKRKFKPEFINRIQKIVYFNRLKDENIKSIVELEIGKLNQKIENLGYHLSENLTHTTMVDEIYNEVISKKEYGARPIVNEVQRKIEDRIVDYIIENDVEDNHTFTYEELSNLD